MLAMLASACWGQSPMGCLIVQGKHHSRVESTGQVPFRMSYSGRELRQLSDEGVKVIWLSKNDHVTPEACMSYAFKLAPVSPPTAALPTAEALCTEVWTMRDGSTICHKWQSSPSVSQ